MSVSGEEACPQFPRESAFRLVCGLLFLLLLSGGAYLLSALPLSPPVRLILGLGVGSILFLPGAWLSRYHLSPGDSLLGGGTVFLFTAVVPWCLQVVPDRPWAGFGASAVLLVLFAALAQRAAGRLAALSVCLSGIWLGSLVLPGLSPVDRAAWLSLAACLLTAWLFLWWARRPYRVFPELALAVLYGCFGLFGAATVREDRFAFALMVLALVCINACCTLLALRYAVQWNRGAQYFAAFNALGFCFAALRLAPDAAWLAPVALLASGMVAAWTAHRHEGLGALAGYYMGQVTLALALLIVLAVPVGFNLILVVLLCSLPAVLGIRHGGRAYRLTEYGLITAVLIASFLTELPRHALTLGPLTLSIGWLFLLAVAAVFIVMGRIHHHWSVHGSVRSPAKLWTLENEQKLLGLTHLFAASLLLMLHTILQRNDSESLPMMLALQGFLFLSLGMLFLDPGLALIGVVPVMAGHACYYAYSYLIPSSAETSAHGQYPAMAVLMAATLLLALVCDDWLGRQCKGRPVFAERFFGMLPYLPMLLPPAILLVQDGSGMRRAAGAGVLGVLGLGIPKLARWPMPGLSTWGYGAALAALFLFLRNFYGAPVPAYANGAYLPALAACLVILALLERIIVPAALGEGNAAMRTTALCAFGLAALGAAGLYRWNDGALFALSLVMLALLLGMTGYLSRTRGYYPAALLVLLLAVAWALLALAGMVG